MEDRRSYPPKGEALFLLPDPELMCDTRLGFCVGAQKVRRHQELGLLRHQGRLTLSLSDVTTRSDNIDNDENNNKNNVISSGGGRLEGRRPSAANDDVMTLLSCRSFPQLWSSSSSPSSRPLSDLDLARSRVVAQDLMILDRPNHLNLSSHEVAPTFGANNTPTLDANNPPTLDTNNITPTLGANNTPTLGANNTPIRADNTPIRADNNGPTLDANNTPIRADNTPIRTDNNGPTLDANNTPTLDANNITPKLDANNPPTLDANNITPTLDANNITPIRADNNTPIMAQVPVHPTPDLASNECTNNWRSHPDPDTDPYTDPNAITDTDKKDQSTFTTNAAVDLSRNISSGDVDTAKRVTTVQNDSPPLSGIIRTTNSSSSSGCVSNEVVSDTMQNGNLATDPPPTAVYPANSKNINSNSSNSTNRNITKAQTIVIADNNSNNTTNTTTTTNSISTIATTTTTTTSNNDHSKDTNNNSNNHHNNNSHHHHHHQTTPDTDSSINTNTTKRTPTNDNNITPSQIHPTSLVPKCSNESPMTSHPHPTAGASPLTSPPLPTQRASYSVWTRSRRPEVKNNKDPSYAIVTPVLDVRTGSSPAAIVRGGRPILGHSAVGSTSSTNTKTSYCYYPHPHPHRHYPDRPTVLTSSPTPTTHQSLLLPSVPHPHQWHSTPTTKPYRQYYATATNTRRNGSLVRKAKGELITTPHDSPTVRQTLSSPSPLYVTSSKVKDDLPVSPSVRAPSAASCNADVTSGMTSYSHTGNGVVTNIIRRHHRQLEHSRLQLWNRDLRLHGIGAASRVVDTRDVNNSESKTKTSFHSRKNSAISDFGESFSSSSNLKGNNDTTKKSNITSSDQNYDVNVDEEAAEENRQNGGDEIVRRERCLYQNTPKSDDTEHDEDTIFDNVHQACPMEDSDDGVVKMERYSDGKQLAAVSPLSRGPERVSGRHYHDKPSGGGGTLRDQTGDRDYVVKSREGSRGKTTNGKEKAPILTSSDKKDAQKDRAAALPESMRHDEIEFKSNLKNGVDGIVEDTNNNDSSYKQKKKKPSSDSGTRTSRPPSGVDGTAVETTVVENFGDALQLGGNRKAGEWVVLRDYKTTGRGGYGDKYNVWTSHNSNSNICHNNCNNCNNNTTTNNCNSNINSNNNNNNNNCNSKNNNSNNCNVKAKPLTVQEARIQTMSYTNYSNSSDKNTKPTGVRKGFERKHRRYNETAADDDDGGDGDDDSGGGDVTNTIHYRNEATTRLPENERDAARRRKYYDDQLPPRDRDHRMSNNNNPRMPQPRRYNPGPRPGHGTSSSNNSKLYWKFTDLAILRHRRVGVQQFQPKRFHPNRSLGNDTLQWRPSSRDESGRILHWNQEIVPLGNRPGSRSLSRQQLLAGQVQADDEDCDNNYCGGGGSNGFFSTSEPGVFRIGSAGNPCQNRTKIVVDPIQKYRPISRDNISLPMNAKSGNPRSVGSHTQTSRHNNNDNHHIVQNTKTASTSLPSSKAVDPAGLIDEIDKLQVYKSRGSNPGPMDSESRQEMLDYFWSYQGMSRQMLAGKSAAAGSDRDRDSQGTQSNEFSSSRNNIQQLPRCSNGEDGKGDNCTNNIDNSTLLTRHGERCVEDGGTENEVKDAIRRGLDPISQQHDDDEERRQQLMRNDRRKVHLVVKLPDMATTCSTGNGNA